MRVGVFVQPNTLMPTLPTPNFFDTSDVPSVQPYFDLPFADPMSDENVLRLYQAEVKVLTYFIDEGPQTTGPGIFDAFPVLPTRPQLKGFVGTIRNPELMEMDELLIEAIKESIANVFARQDDDANIRRLEEGDRTVVFKTSLQKKDLRPLMVHDGREPFTYL